MTQGAPVSRMKTPECPSTSIIIGTTVLGEMETSEPFGVCFKGTNETTATMSGWFGTPGIMSARAAGGVLSVDTAPAVGTAWCAQALVIATSIPERNVRQLAR